MQGTAHCSSLELKRAEPSAQVMSDCEQFQANSNIGPRRYEEDAPHVMPTPCKAYGQRPGSLLSSKRHLNLALTSFVSF